MSQKILFRDYGSAKSKYGKNGQAFQDIPSFPRSIENQVVTDAHYMGYLKETEI